MLDRLSNKEERLVTRTDEGMHLNVTQDEAERNGRAERHNAQPDQSSPKDIGLCMNS